MDQKCSKVGSASLWAAHQNKKVGGRRVQRSLQKVQGHRVTQGRSRPGRDSTHRQPCGTCPQSGGPV